MKRKILITGSTGRTGKLFVKELEQRKSILAECDLAVTVRRGSDTSILDASGIFFEKLEGDLLDPLFCDTITKGVDTIVHIAGIHYSLPFVSIAAQNRVRRIIAVHTTGIYSKYKEAGEEYRQIDKKCYEICKSCGTSLTILRPTMIYGDTDDANMVRFIKLCDRFPVIPTVSGARYLLQPVHRGDLAKAYCDVLVNEEGTMGKDYILSGDRPILLRDILALISSDLGKKARFLSVPFSLAFIGAWTIYAASFKRIDIREKVQRLVEDRSYPHDKAEEDFGYSPRRFEEGIRIEVRAYLSEKVNKS